MSLHILSFLASHLSLILPLQSFCSKIWPPPLSSSLTGPPAPLLTLSHTLTILFTHPLSVCLPYSPPKPSPQLTHILHTSSPSYILPGCHPLVLECLHLPKSLYMARGRYVSSPFTLHPAAPTPTRIAHPPAPIITHKASFFFLLSAIHLGFPSDFALSQSADITYQPSMLDSWATTTTNRNSEDPTELPRRKEWDTSAHSQSPSRPDPVRHNFTSPFHTILSSCLKPLPHYCYGTAFY